MAANTDVSPPSDAGGLLDAARTTIKRVLRSVPPYRGWLAANDRLAEETREWRAERRRAIGGTEPEQDEIRALLSMFSPVRAIGVHKLRVGGDGDGGYVMLDDFAGIDAALSLGIGDECSWDLDIAGRGIEVYQYDPTVDGPPVAHPRFHFFKRKIGATAAAASDNIGSALARIPAAPGQRRLLKIDIEGGEWPAFDAATPAELGQFSQIVCELHGFSSLDQPHVRALMLRVMTKLQQQFAVVHVHGNNYAMLRVVRNVAFPGVIEVTLANRAMYRFEPTDEIFPTPLDRPNCRGRVDVFLGSLRFN